MKTPSVRTALIVLLLALPVLSRAQAPALPTIKLNEPDKHRGLPVMEALSLRASVREWSDQDMSLRDLSDLLWAANGINRPESKKRTAASARNSQDVDIYVFRKDGVYLYDAASHALTPVVAGDFRGSISRPLATAAGAKAAPAPRPDPVPTPAAALPGSAPVILLLVSDAARFGGGTPESNHEMGAIDAGIVSQNIALFCAGTGMVTRPRASMDRDGLRALLGLKSSQYPFLNQPVGYPSKAH